MFPTSNIQTGTTRGIPTSNLRKTAVKNNFSATTAPGSTDDIGAGYNVGSQWINTVTDRVYSCTDSSLGAANWAWLNDTGGGGGTPGGITGNVQYNDSGSFGGSNNLFWNSSTNRLGINTSTPSTSLHVTGSTTISSNLFVGDGSWRQRMEDFDMIFEYNDGVTWIKRLEIEGDALS
jgi:hypothetical protein